ncbi:MAG: gamma carbonic anhydrase family protein [Rhodobacterales bacterium]|nr:gamma carbonic anhydrase family protein [Rhodobacterales bacterium]
MTQGPIILPYGGHVPRIDSRAFVAPGAAVIGDVEIGPDSSVWFACVLRGDVHQIRVGARTNIQDGSVVHVTQGKFGAFIGDDILIGHSALIHGCVLEDGCFVGMKATVMDGAVVEGGAMVAAGSLVTPGKRVKAGELWAGAPARKIRELSAEDLAGFKVATEHYAEVAAKYRDAGIGVVPGSEG